VNRTRKCLEMFFLLFPISSSTLPNLHEVVQRARPSHNPRGTCPCWSEPQPRREGQNPTPNSIIARGRGKRIRVDHGVARKCVTRTQMCHSQMIALSNVFLSSSFLKVKTCMRSCNGHVPPIIKEGRARAGQSTSRSGRGKKPAPNSS
jgi:hypothetical protein